MTERTLVTGAGGFCGRSIVAALVAGGHDVVATVRPGSLAAAMLPRDLEAIECDLADAHAVRALVARTRPARCVHAAAAGARARSDDLDQLVDVNVRATATLVESLARHGAERFVGLGSSSEYGPCEDAMSEQTTARPDDLYGISKLAGGLAAHALGALHGIETVQLRLFSVYGPGEAPGRLVPALLHALSQQLPVDLGDGRQARDFVYVGDVADAVLQALHADLPAGITVNVGTGIQSTVRELALHACHVTGADRSLLRFGVLPARPRERLTWRADTRLARSLGFRADTSLVQGLAQTLQAVAGEELAA